MAAVSLIRSKTKLTSFYNRLRAAGKPPKVALVAAARKLGTSINSVI
jgi:transposase